MTATSVDPPSPARRPACDPIAKLSHGLAFARRAAERRGARHGTINAMNATVRGLNVTPVKGLRLRPAQRLEIGRAGATGDRRFYIIDARGRMINGKQAGQLNAVVAELSEDRLALTFPDGSVVEAPVRDGEPVRTRFYSIMREDRLLRGPWAQAVSEHVAQPVRLVQATGGSAIDRGGRGGISVISHASLARLASEADVPEVDARRFRMTIEIDGVAAHEEDSWIGRRARIGSTLVQFRGHVGRCLITSRDPDTGAVNLPTLDILGNYRANTDTTEPLPFGVYGEVLEPGVVSIGDALTLAG